MSLNPCPFCGGTEKTCLDRGYSQGTVKCMDCNISLPFDQWQTRVPDPAVEKLAEALRSIVNASFTELRPVVEKYRPVPDQPSAFHPGGKCTLWTSHATEKEWEVVVKTAEYFQEIAARALAKYERSKEK